MLTEFVVRPSGRHAGLVWRSVLRPDRPTTCEAAARRQGFCGLQSAGAGEPGFR